MRKKNKNLKKQVHITRVCFDRPRKKKIVIKFEYFDRCWREIQNSHGKSILLEWGRVRKWTLWLGRIRNSVSSDSTHIYCIFYSFLSLPWNDFQYLSVVFLICGFIIIFFLRNSCLIKKIMSCVEITSLCIELQRLAVCFWINMRLNCKILKLFSFDFFLVSIRLNRVTSEFLFLFNLWLFLQYWWRNETWAACSSFRVFNYRIQKLKTYFRFY